MVTIILLLKVLRLLVAHAPGECTWDAVTQDKASYSNVMDQLFQRTIWL